jgi:hypothetical protein
MSVQGATGPEELSGMNEHDCPDLAELNAMQIWEHDYLYHRGYGQLPDLEQSLRLYWYGPEYKITTRAEGRTP